MKKIFILSFAFFANMATFAQTGNPIVFVDGQGNVIQNGSTVIRDDVEFSAITGIGTLHSDIYVKNMTDAPLSCKVSCEVEGLPYSQFQICGFGSCQPLPFMESIATYPVNGTIDCDPVTIAAGETKNTQSEWLRVKTGKYGSFKVKYSILNHGEITVNFVYQDPTGIDNLQTAKEKKVLEYYTIDGQRLDNPKRGMNIVKYSDGTVEKRILK